MANVCKHCKQDNYSTDVDFCCDGCQSAYNFVKSLNLDSFYTYRPHDIVNEKVNLDNIVSIKDNFIDEGANSNSINLVADDMKCAACAWLIENALLKDQDIIAVNINLFSKKVIIEYSKTADIQKIIKGIYMLGYKVYPYSYSVAEKMHNQYKKSLLKKMAVAAFFAMNVMLFSVSMWFGDDIESNIENLFKILSFTLALPAIIYSGSEFFKSALNSIKIKAVNMDIAISVAILLSFVYSTYNTFYGTGEIYFESSLMLIFFLLVGRFIELKTKEKISLLAENIILSDIQYSTIIQNDKTVEILSENIKKEDIIALQKGEKLATDAILLDDTVSFDVSNITGEFIPKAYHKGDEVPAGVILLGNSIKLKAVNDFKDNSISAIIKIISDSQKVKDKKQLLAEKISKIYVPVVHILTVICFVYSYYYLKLGFDTSITRSIALLIITCPCALALAIPVANIATLSRLLKKGILLKNPKVLEIINNISAIFYDKTGTLVNIDINIPDDISKDDLMILKAMTCQSKHVLSKNIYNQLNDIQEAVIDSIDEVPGQGVQVKYNGKTYKLGSAEFCKVEEFNGLVFKVKNKSYKLNYTQKLITHAKESIFKFKIINLYQHIISGDNEQNVKQVASGLNIPYSSNLKPIEKQDYITNYKQKNNNSLLMYIGDGINDAASLAKSDISVSFADASQIAQINSDVILKEKNLKLVEKFFTIAKSGQRKVKQNLAIAFIYNICAVPAAFAGLVSPFFAAIFMSLSSVCVILNVIRR